MEPKVKPRSGAPSGNDRKRFGDPRKSFGSNKPRANERGGSRSNSGSSWGGKSFGGNGGRPSTRDGGGFGGNRSRGRG